MTVAELIAKLQKAPQHYIVYAESDYGIAHSILVAATKYDDAIPVWEEGRDE